MPSKTLGKQGLSSSSYFADEVGFPSERQNGFWKKEIATGHYAENSTIAPPTVEKFMQVDPQPEKLLGHKNQKVNTGTGTHTVRAGEAASYSSALWGPVAHGLGGRPNLSAQSSYFSEDGKMNKMGAQDENGLFSSSFSDLFTKKLRLSANHNLLGHSVDTVVHYEEDEPFKTLEEIEAQTIGNLLPNDDDLLSGAADGINYIIQPGHADDVEDLDLFSSLGGMDLGDDCSYAGQRNSEDSEGTFSGQMGGFSGSLTAEHPFGEHPSRTLFVRNINSNVEDSELHSLFEQYGDVRTLYTACKHRGFVMISYYDIRAAQNAMRALQNKPLRRRKLDIHFSIPKDNPSEKDINQGTLVVFNIDSSVSNDEIHRIFGVYGDIKEIRETPQRSHHKFIEFYDVRAAESAFHALNQSDIAGKRITLEHSHSAGARCLMQQLPSDLEQDDSGVYLQSSNSPKNSATGFAGLVSREVLASSSMNNKTLLGMQSALHVPIAPFLENSFHHGISSSVPESLSSLVRADSVVSESGPIECGQSLGHLKFDLRGAPGFHPHSLPEYNEVLANGAPCKSPVTIASSIRATPSDRIENAQMRTINSKGHSVELSEGVFGSAGNRSFPLIGHHYMWNSIRPPQPSGMMWPNSPSFVNGAHTAPPPRVHVIPSTPSQMLSPVAAFANHHVGSAPAVNRSLWERQHAYRGESPEASGFLPGSLGSTRINSLHHLDFVSPNIFPNVGGNCVDLQIPPKNVGLHSHHQRCVMFPGRGRMIPLMSSFDPSNERSRSRRVENSYNQADKKQYELDIDRILRGEDSRTTLMIKNIPNKYTSKMLLATIDERHRGTYDFIYLPIDFKNKCNVGYAFINMTDPNQIVPFYQEINGKKWEKFNSEKVASLAYARIQGKAALVAHFQNSSLMNEDKRCRPILFHTDGPNAGDQVPFPMGVNIRSRPGKNRTSTTQNHQESPSNLENREESSGGESSSGSAKELQF